MKFEDYIPLVKHLAGKYARDKARPIADTEEYSDACLGLLNALRCFDKDSGVEFATYAYHVIQNEIWQGHKRKKRFIGTQTDFIEPSYTEEISIESPTLERIKDKPGDKAQVKRIKFVLRERFIKDKTLADIGSRLKLSRERIRQIEEKGLQMLRDGEI